MQGSQPVGNLPNACAVRRRPVRYAGCWTLPPAACQTPLSVLVGPPRRGSGTRLLDARHPGILATCLFPVRQQGSVILVRPRLIPCRFPSTQAPGQWLGTLRAPRAGLPRSRQLLATQETASGSGCSSAALVFEHRSVWLGPGLPVRTDHTLNMSRIILQRGQISQKVIPRASREDPCGVILNFGSQRPFAQKLRELVVDEHGVAIRQVGGNELDVIGRTAAGNALLTGSGAAT